MNWSEVFTYDEKSPSCLKWAIDIPYKDLIGGKAFKRRRGDLAGCLNASRKGYERWKVKYQQKAYMVHRIVYEIHNGPIPQGTVIDHINGNALDNRISNLRVVTQTVNARNAKRKNHKKQERTGVTFRKTGNYEYYAAAWTDLEGRMQNKYFSIAKLGEELAEFLAEEYRSQQIQLLNLAGACYTDRHGT